MIYFAFFILGSASFYLQRFFPLTTALFCLALIVWFVFERRTAAGGAITLRKLAAMVMLALAVAGLGYFRTSLFHREMPAPETIAGASVTLDGRPEGVAAATRDGRFMQLFRVTGAASGETRLSLETVRTVTEEPLRRDAEYRLWARIPADLSSLNPGASAGIIPVFATSSEERNTITRTVLDIARDRLNAELPEAFPGDSGAFLMSIITGERSTMTREMRDAFNATGLVHILSISGAHFGLLLFILFRLFRSCFRLLPDRMLERFSLYCSPNQASAILCMPVMAAYLGLSTMAFPAVRAFIMITLFLAGLLIERRGFWLTTLLFAAALIVAVDPASIIDLSFQLSFIAVLAIGLYAQVSGGMEDASVPEQGRADEPSLRNRFVNKSVKALKASIAVSLAASAGTAPLVAYHFNYASLISPLTNLVITPFIGFVILPVALLASFIFLLTGHLPFQPVIERATGLSLEMVMQAASVPMADVKIPSFPVMLLILFYAALFWFVVMLMKMRNDGRQKVLILKLVAPAVAIGLVPLLLYGCFASAGNKEFMATFLDVGQGDASVIELPDGKVVVMDTGTRGTQVADFLRSRGRREIDLVIISHGHPDHGGGLHYLMDRFGVRELWDNGLVQYAFKLPEGVVHRNVERGDMLKGPGYVITALHPYSGFYSSGPSNQEDNNGSLVVKIEAAGVSLLFSGDISRDAEEELLPLGPMLRSRVLKVPHHGSRTSLSPGFLQAVAPEIAVISVGRSNSYGHPHPDTVALLGATRLFRTDREGAVGIRPGPLNGITVRIGREARLEAASGRAAEAANLKKLFNVW